jgi:glycosyltransferase involved in cell wall biosynthesis
MHDRPEPGARRPLRVLALSKYDRLAASARQRFVLYQPALARRGIELELSPLFDDAYLRERFGSGAQRAEHVGRAIARRLRAMLEVRRHDLAIVHYELIPFLPAPVERALLAGVPYVHDFDDAIFHTYDEHRRPAVRRALGDKIGRVIAGARAVLAGSRYLADYAARYNREVHLVPTVVDLDRYRVLDAPRTGGPFTVSWIGSPSTSEYLAELVEPLSRLAAEGPVRLVAVGARPFDIPGVQVEVRPWREDREVEDILEGDVGVMPLPDIPWARGKCAFKLIQYMGCGLPVVASPVGANHEVVGPETGFLAAGPDAWLDALRRLRDDPALRMRLGAAGRARIEAGFSLASQADRVAGVLERAAGGPR